MNASQLLAWLVCLFLAFGAAVLSVHNSFKLAALENQFERTERVATEQTVVLKELRDLLQHMSGESGDQ